MFEVNVPASSQRDIVLMDVDGFATESYVFLKVDGERIDGRVTFYRGEGWGEEYEFAYVLPLSGGVEGVTHGLWNTYTVAPQLFRGPDFRQDDVRMKRYMQISAAEFDAERDLQSSANAPNTVILNLIQDLETSPAFPGPDGACSDESQGQNDEEKRCNPGQPSSSSAAIKSELAPRGGAARPVAPSTGSMSQTSTP